MLVGQICAQSVSWMCPPTHQNHNVPVAVVHLGLRTKQFLLPRLVRKVSPHLIPVFLSLQRGDKVYPRPHLLAREFAVIRQYDPEPPRRQ
jgi:hypothetical protein